MSLPRPAVPDQEFFNIGEACRIVQLPDYTLRYWESKLKLLRPARRSSGHRRYSRRDLEIILRIKELVCSRHMTLLGARKALLHDLRKGSMEPEPPAANGGRAQDSLLKLLRELRSEMKGLLSEL